MLFYLLYFIIYIDNIIKNALHVYNFRNLLIAIYTYINNK